MKEGKKAQVLWQQDKHRLFLTTTINQEGLNKKEGKGMQIH